VLPGAYLSGADAAASPGRPYIRVALVDEPETVDAALARMTELLEAA
jgi:aspartate/methionine/tyrosine aminotransferase